MNLRSTRSRHIAIALVSSIGIALSGTSRAQNEPPAVPPPEAATPTPPEVAPLEEKKIDQFADAYLAIEEIHAKAAAELEQTTDPASADQVKSKAETRIIEAVEQSGLRLDEFNQIAELMAVDMALRTKIASRVEQRRRI